MEKIYKRFGLLAVMLLAASFAFAQTTISGTVKDGKTGETLAGVNIIVKGKVVGTNTDVDGNFTLKVNQAPPLTIALSFVGYKAQEIEITSASTTGLNINLEEQVILGQEIVVSASRVEESILESPVSIEKMDILAVQTTPADSYYKGLANLKGVDVTTSSINFQILNARGFGSTGNTRFVQLTDGMDTQAPALNFPIGNLNGPSELDVESVEMLPGASSALYGPNAFNGIILVNSKSPFDYQGLSVMSKVGVNHVGSDADYDGPAPMWEGAIRYAKSFNNKIAFKVNFAFMKAEDWHGTDATDREAARKPTGFDYNPGADKYHYMGDEASINMAIFPNSASWQTFASTASPYYNNIFESGVSALSYAQAGDLPSNIVSVTPYKEADLIDYGAKNLKANVGLYYRLTDKLELSALYNGGFGTSIYTGAQRYSLNNFGIEQYRLQLRGDNFFVRGYTTRENSGDSYITEFLAKRVNDLAVNNANPLFNDLSGYLATYAGLYLRSLYNQGLAPGEIQTLADAQRIIAEQTAHDYARNIVDNGGLAGGVNYRPMHLDVNSADFKRIKKEAMNGTVPTGPKFADKTNLYHVEGQYDFKNQVESMELQVGGSYRVFDLNSNGTIFDDGDENITIKEYGAYVQAGKWFADRKFKLSGSLRFDKNQNFNGRVNPRISGVYKVGENHNIRLSYQTGFRNPSTQGQHIDLDIITSRLLGGLQRYADKYNIPSTSNTDQPLSFDGTSVQAFRNNFFATGDLPGSTALLKPFTKFDPVKPEKVQSIEVGYKGLFNNNFLIDVAYYFNIYNDFITQVQVINAQADGSGNPNYLTILNSTSANTFSIYTNSPEQVKAQGFVGGLTYNLLRGYTLSGNYNWNKLSDVPEGFVAEFNTPEHKVNFSFGNRKVTENIGFNVTWRWQAAFDWQSSFTLYTLYPVPAYNTLDAQVTYKLKGLKSMLKLGGSNILNQKYIQSGGGPNISGIYYVSITFDQLMN